MLKLEYALVTEMKKKLSSYEDVLINVYDKFGPIEPILYKNMSGHIPFMVFPMFLASFTPFKPWQKFDISG